MNRSWGKVCASVFAVASILAAPICAQKPPTAHPVKGKATQPENLLAAIEELRAQLREQARELEATRAAFRAQQEKLEALERRLPSGGVRLAASTAEPSQGFGDASPPDGSTPAAPQTSEDLQNRLTKLHDELTTANRNVESRFKQLGNFRFSGDVRFRYENFLQKQQTTRQRQRIRARLNLLGNISDELYGGFSFASGSLDDPISTNQTLTGFFNRKTVGFDRFFIQYRPKYLGNHVTFGLGKFAYPWVRTGLTFDVDLNPEGIYSQFNWDFEYDVFKGITLVGFHLPFFERGGATDPATGVRADGLDAFIAGGQVQTRWKFGDRVHLGLNMAGINFVNVDFIAQAHSPNPATASLANNLLGNQPTTNSLRTNAAGQVIGFASRFLYLDTILTAGIDTGHARWPVNVTFDFVNNTRAQTIIQNGTNAPTGTVHNRERSAYWAEFQFGRLAERKDIQFGYIYTRIERDAVLGAFAESDLRAGTNINQHRLNFSYQWLNNVSLNYVLWLGRMQNAPDSIFLVPGGKRAIAGGPCHTAPFSGCTDNMLKRMQFDLIYRF